ncbi:type I-E CRISPR-associated protein Cas6/Cse3/CasE [Escherichia coli]|nr:type I-E CRISPR-associated protein Cas6/Cse3/CasE [Escherichia coli]
MNERLKTHSKTQKKSADLVSNKLRIGVFQRYQMKCKSVSKKSPRYNWLAAQGERSGFTLLDTSVDAYRQQQLRRENSRQLIQFSSVDYTGMLTVTDPGLFVQRLSQGYGKSRAFGCGLMLIKPGAEA